MEKMKPALLASILAILLLSGCTTIQNRRDLYSPQPVEGPYTRMLKDGSWRKQKVADVSVDSGSPADGSTSSDSKMVKTPVL
jgi:outer membrane protein assembly factor BamE (lipoprotein component of BamABCDE complex)